MLGKWTHSFSMPKQKRNDNKRNQIPLKWPMSKFSTHKWKSGKMWSLCSQWGLFTIRRLSRSQAVTKDKAKKKISSILNVSFKGRYVLLSLIVGVVLMREVRGWSSKTTWKLLHIPSHTKLQWLSEEGDSLVD